MYTMHDLLYSIHDIMNSIHEIMHTLILKYAKSLISQVLIGIFKKFFWIPIGTFILEFLVVLNPTISQLWVKIVYMISCILYMMHMHTIHDAHVYYA